VILLKSSCQLIGMIELRMHGTHADLGYGIARAYWGQGYATEAAQAVVDWSFSQPEIYRVWTVCDVDNLASVRVLEKVGMQREGILRRWLVRPTLGPEPRDCYCYSKVK
jgi:RimJ/RimL family protein N-acetyltransferase